MNTVSPWRRGQLGQLLDRDGIIAYPTEGVWGLGCLPESEAAVLRLLGLKKRSWQQGLLLVAAEIGQFMPYLENLGEDAMTRLEAAWPGPTTFLVPDNGAAPAWIVGEHDTLGLRVSAHPIVSRLCHWFGPLVSTSANVTGHPAAMTAFDVRRYFGSGIDTLVPGRLGGRGGPSRIVHLASGEIRR